jgi:molybdate transport system substrate-binding protein
MAAVEAGNADTAVVYRTDVTGRDRVVVVYEVPIDRAPRIVYPAGIVANSRQHDRARRLLKWLRGATASRGFDEAGFGVPEAAPVR